MSCVFCDIAREQIVAEDELTTTLRDGYPVSPGHTLIIPRRHISSMTEATPEELQAILQSLAAARATLDHERQPDGYNIGINDGAAAGQTVMHLHVHLIPRFTGDMPNPRGGIRHCVQGKGYYDPGKHR
jgi:diadenosine tetraphosphate (Ap4A) HIT family hydrolase